MLYKHNKAQSLPRKLFLKPACEYRAAPFWAWNSYLEKEELLRQIDVFKEMGLGGFHMHVRTGLKNKYLSGEFMSLIKDCVKKAEQEEMLAWLYDEDRWPSGSAGGMVTKDERLRGRFLLFTPFEPPADDKILACYDIILDENACLSSYKKINADDEVQGTKWFALQKICEPSPWYNGQAYVDTLNENAIRKFIEVTHETYKDAVGEAFGETVPAIFTDEPQFVRKETLSNSFDKTDIRLPWTDSVPEKYGDMYGADIFDTLPELFWDLPAGSPSVHRYRYHNFIAELFASAFADTAGGWCRKNNFALTGHMMEEPSLHSQCAALGEAMRSYRGFDLPGIDILCNSHEFTTAKQAQSAVHQYGREGMVSELYGVTGWDCDFRTYKHQGDWQAALGVTVRVPHLSWYAMGGEAKRDYPASIHYQSPWYKKFNVIEDHFARVNTALTRGKPVVKVGVVHPIESFWLHWGPNDKSAVLRESLDSRFSETVKWLLEGSIDFDFISESLLPSQCASGSAPLKVGEMEYDAVIVPGCETLRSSTLERLEAFRRGGGKLIFMGEAPSLCDAEPSSRGTDLYNRSETVAFSRSALLTALEDTRTLTLRYADGRLTDCLIYQMRQDNDCRWLFICFTKEPFNKDTDRGICVNVCLNGIYSPEIYNTADGSVSKTGAEIIEGKTIIPLKLYGYDSVLLRLSDDTPTLTADKQDDSSVQTALPGITDYELSEENVLLLDMAEYKLSGDKQFSKKEELLRLDNVCRKRLGLRERGGECVQPWVNEEQPDADKLTLRFTFDSEIEYDGAYLALEEFEKVESIIFNGTSVPKISSGNYVDISIEKVKLPAIVKGENTLEITYSYGESTDIENMMILGRFGVTLKGTDARIVKLPETVGFGDLTPQGFPFYGGNITYKCKANAVNGKIRLRVSRYRGAMVSVFVDGEEKGDIIYPPYILTIENLSDGEHDVEIRLYIHRYNTFGPLHLTNEKESWHGPNAWRSENEFWSYEYVLRSTGILAAPAVIE